MSLELIFGTILFAFASSITPGPNNIMLLTSGVNFGFIRTIRHLLGVSIGFFILALCVGLGLGALLKLFPPLYLALKICSVAYLLYLSWRVAFSRSLKSAQAGKGRPITFVEALLFQWINPKAWVMAVTAMTLYVTEGAPWMSVLIVAAVFCAVNFPCICCWAGFGTTMRSFLANPVRLRIFNIIMGILLVASAIPILIGEILLR